MAACGGWGHKAKFCKKNKENKNPGGGEVHEKHSRKMIGEKGKSELEINKKKGRVGDVDV